MFKHHASQIVALAFLMIPTALLAQTAPQIGYLFPAGAQRGSKVQVEIGGKYMPGPCGFWIGGTGVRSSTNTTQGTVVLTVDADAESGMRPIRIHSVQGGSSPRAFVVGDLPEVMEVAEADQQSVPLGSTINGRLHPSDDIDQYEFSLTQGKAVVCAIAMHSLGSPGDTVLRLLDSGGRVVAVSDNQRGLDPLLVWQCRQTGRYVLQVYDFNLSGAANYVYRLTVTDGPYLDYAFPVGVQAGVQSEVTLHGWNLPSNSLKQTIKAGTGNYRTNVAGSANQLTLPVSDVPEFTELEPNESTAPQQIVVPAVINGRLQQPGDVDVYKFVVKKGERFVIRVESEQIGFPADAVLRVLKADGQLIRETDDVGTSRDPEYAFVAPTDGEYLLSVEERAGRGGSRFVYRLHVLSPSPSLRLTVKTAEFTVIPGETLTIPVRIEPLDGFDKPLELHVTNLPAGVTVETVKHVPKKAGDVKLEFKAAADANFKSGTFEIIARADDVSSELLATARIATSTVLAADAIPLWLAVGPKVPFQLATVGSIQEAPRLAAFPFPVAVTRDAGFQSAIRLVGVDPDGRGTVVPLSGNIAANTDAGAIPLIIQPAAIEGTTHRCRVMGVAEITGPDGKPYSVFHVATGSMLMGCQPNWLTLTATPNRVLCKVGQSIALQLTIERRMSCGDVTVSLLPISGIRGVAAKPVLIVANQTQAMVTVEFASDATLPPEFQLHFQAESSRNGLPVYARAIAVFQTR
ncbi:MAG: PPC domain-containing protein [Planctomycetota bacterium]|nr:PPC domain-containing protein [Planctomycetota bacterium]